jgi:hypothetical protein
MIVPVLQLPEVGLVADRPPHRIAPNALSRAVNVRLDYAGLRTAGAFQDSASLSLNDQLIDLYILPDGSIVLCGLKALYRYYPSSGSVTQISSGTFTGSLTDRWLGGIFNNFLVLTNGKDVPVYYDYNGAGNAAAVPGWTSGRRALCIRPLVYHLAALGVIINGTPDYRRVWWSSSADPNTMPSTWDTSLYTADSGEVTLPNGNDPIIDGLQLGSSFVVYTREQTWLMRYIGGTQVFAFSQLSNQSGLLAPGCAVHLQGLGHFAVTRNDVVLVSDTITSVAEGRIRRWLFDAMDPVSYHTCRVLHLPNFKEVLIFFPAMGSGYPNRAAVWNYGTNVWSTLEFDRVCRSVAYKGPTVYSEIYTIESDTAQCDANDGVQCDDTPASYESTEVLLAISGPLSLSEYRSGSSGNATVEREGLAFVGPEEQDEWRFKRVLGLRLDATGPDGAVVTIDYGIRMSHQSPTQWIGSVDYILGTTEEAQFEAVGRFLAFRFRWSNPDVRLLGYYYDVHSLGEAF